MKAAGSAGGRAPALTSRTLAGLQWAFLGAGARTLLSLGIVMALSRLLTPEDFGRMAIALVFLALAETAGRRSIGPAIMQRLELTEGHVATGLTLALAIGVVLTAVLLAMAPLVGAVTGDAGVVPVLEVLAGAAMLSALGVTSEHLLRRDLRFREVMAASILSQAVGHGLVALALALLDHGVWALVWGLLARHGVFALAVVAFRPPPRRLRLCRREAAELLRTGGGFSAIALLNAAARHGVNLLVARALGPAALGLYTRASRLALAPAIPTPVLRSVLMPAMASRQDRRERIASVHQNGLEIYFLAAFPASLMVAVAAPEIVAFVLGGQWQGAVPAVRVLALAGAFRACDALHLSVVRAMGAVWRESWRRGSCLVVLAAGAWLGSRWGLAGVAAAVAAAWLVLHLLVAQLALSLLRIGWRRYGRRLVPALWAALWATPALWLAAALARDASLGAAAALAVELTAWGAAGGAAVYLAPAFARPAFPHWVLAQFRFDEMGRAGSVARAVLRHLARRWPRPDGGAADGGGADAAGGTDRTPEPSASAQAAPARPRGRYKRAFDLALVAGSTPVLALLWLAAALAVRLEDGGPVLLMQPRLGRGGRLFDMLKFRTMAVDAEAGTGPVWAAEDDPRATRVGRVLRRLHLDELPQVVNVLKGEMSLVGPRPERPELAARIERSVPGFSRRLAVRPGIAGLAQARQSQGMPAGAGMRTNAGRKLRYDMLYIAKMSPWLDLRLCVRCLYLALRGARRPAVSGRVPPKRATFR